MTISSHLKEIDKALIIDQVKAENTYLLALDGDIDFQAESITRLVDLMKKNRDLGAACGRIHPTGVDDAKLTYLFYFNLLSQLILMQWTA